MPIPISSQKKFRRTVLLSVAGMKGSGSSMKMKRHAWPAWRTFFVPWIAMAWSKVSSVASPGKIRLSAGRGMTSFSDVDTSILAV
jgi:hypothetical protein